MLQKDYFQRYLDQFGKALAQVLAKLTGTDYSGDAALRMDALRKVYLEELNLDIEKVIAQEDDKLISFLFEELGLAKENAELIAESLLLYEDSGNARQKAGILLQFHQRNSDNFSLDLQNRIDELLN